VGTAWISAVAIHRSRRWPWCGCTWVVRAGASPAASRSSRPRCTAAVNRVIGRPICSSRVRPSPRGRRERRERAGPMPGAADRAIMSEQTPKTTTLDEPSRLLDLRTGAKYLGISYWSLRDLVINGHVPAVRLPCPRTRNGRIMRRLLVDRRDLDALIER